MADVTISREAVELAARALAESDTPPQKWEDLQPSAQYRWAVRAKAALTAAARLIVATDLEMFTKVLQEVRDEQEISSGDVLRQYRRRAEQLRAQS